jgi:putative lipase involved disintegration of autophagic bodies
VNKLLIIAFLLINICLSVTDFGFIFGGGLSQAYGSKDQAADYNIDIKTYPVLRTGLYSDHKITDNLHLVQEVLYSQKGSKQRITVKEQPVNFNLQYELDYLEVPFLIKYTLINFGIRRIYEKNRS